MCSISVLMTIFNLILINFVISIKTVEYIKYLTRDYFLLVFKPVYLYFTIQGNHIMHYYS